MPAILRHKESISNASIVLEAPAGLRGALEPLLPRLAEKGFERLVVFSYGRPGDPLYWLAYVLVAGKRHSLGTPELRNLPLDEQARDLVRQLAVFEATNTVSVASLLPGG